MALKLRFVTIFLISFGILTFFINGRFLVAYAKFWAFNEGFESQLSQNSTAQLPLSEDIKIIPLPDNATLVIDKLGIKAPIVFGVGTDTKSIYKGLEAGVVHYSATPKPGMDGTAIIWGHSSAYPWYRGNYGSVFALLSKLQAGDRFYIQYEDGRSFTFTMKQSFIFNPFAKDGRLAELEKNEKPTVILLSCWPVGTDYKRIAVQAELI